MSTVVSFEDNVKRRMKDMVADLIPEERWATLVASTISDFEKIDLPKLIKEELAAKYRVAIANEFAKEEWQAKWSAAGQMASPAVQKLLVEAAPAVLASMLNGAAQSVIQQLQYALQNNRNY